jgi:type III pantothenate kinase
MKLWLDVGNTRLKWQLYQDASFVVGGSIVHHGDMTLAISSLLADTQNFTANSAITFVGLASVLNVQALNILKLACQEKFGINLHRAEVSRELKGVTCVYQDVSKLGIDRWLAAVAAFNQKKTAVCVVDCGSALTIDMVNNVGKHLGGFILPGLNMSAKALLGQTHSVRFDDDVLPEFVSLGRDTASAVMNGVLLQAQSSIRHAWDLFEIECLGDKNIEVGRLLITGGDASAVVKGLDLNFELQDDLVIQGLRLALE